MKYFFFLLFLSLITSCAVFEPKKFPENVLEDKLLTTERNTISFQEILNQNPNKDKFVQIFATYCPVSQDSFYDVLEFQKENPEKEYIFLSVDHSYHDWKRGLKDIKPKGKFYYLSEKEESVLGEFLKLKSIPRFLKIDKHGKIKVYNASSVSKKLK